MGDEGGLDAIRSIKQVINDQEEKVWRVAAVEKFKKKEIEKLLSEWKQYEFQIETVKSESPYRSTKDVPRLVKDAIDHDIQTKKFLLIAIDSKKIEIENKKRDIKLWEEKYNAVVNDFKVAYEQRKAFYELHNPAFIHLKQSEVARELALIDVKRLKVELKTAKRIFIELNDIKRKMLYTKVINFVTVTSRQKQNAELNVKLQKAIARRRELGVIMLERQKAWKKQNLINIQRRNDSLFSNMVPKIDFAKREVIPNKQEIHSSRINVENTKKIENAPVDDKKNKQIVTEPIKQNCNKIKVIDNKKVNLRPLKSILNESRSNWKRERLSQESNFSDKSQLQIKPGSSEKNQYNLPEINVTEKTSTKLSAPPNTSCNMSFDRLKNVKLITKYAETIRKKIPTKFSFENQCSKEIPKHQQTPTINMDVVKRKLEAEKVNDNVKTPSAKKDRSVNFANPIEEHCDSKECSSNQKADIDATLQSNISLLDYNILEEETVLPAGSFQDNFPQIMTKPFSFNYGGAKTDESNNIQSIPINSPPSMFEDMMDARPTFSFSFGRGVSEATNMWNSFN